MSALKHIYLIPTYLTEQTNPSEIPTQVKDTIKETKVYFVEQVRTARRYISSLKLGVTINELEFIEIGKHADTSTFKSQLKSIKADRAGIISEAGYPAIADPGAYIVKIAHQLNIKITPLPGSSSIFLALSTSGFSGQQFTFHGYLPIDEKERSIKIKDMERDVIKSGYSQIFMDTPFRNEKLLKAVLNNTKSNTLLNLAVNLNHPEGFSKTKTSSEWKKDFPSINKVPAIFILGK